MRDVEAQTRLSPISDREFAEQERGHRIPTSACAINLGSGEKSIKFLRIRSTIDLRATQGGVAMGDLFLLSKAQMRRIERYFPLSHGIARVDDRRVISGIIFVIRNGLRWRDAPKDYGPHKTIYNRFIRWSRLGVFNRIFAALAAQGRQAATG